MSGTLVSTVIATTNKAANLGLSNKATNSELSNKATNSGLSPGDWRAIGVSEEGESFAAMGRGMGGVWGGRRRSRSLAGAFAWRKSCGGLLSMFVSFFLFFFLRLADAFAWM